jgi:hypothetical protein
MSEQERIAELQAILRDIAMGADMMLPLFSGAALSYAKEVKRVANEGAQL